jgi:hypothetical protein
MSQQIFFFFAFFFAFFFFLKEKLLEKKKEGKNIKSKLRPCLFYFLKVALFFYKSEACRKAKNKKQSRPAQRAAGRQLL